MTITIFIVAFLSVALTFIMVLLPLMVDREDIDQLKTAFLLVVTSLLWASLITLITYQGL